MAKPKRRHLFLVAGLLAGGELSAWNRPNLFWISHRMDNESVLFVQRSATSKPTASLWFRPTSIFSIKSAITGRQYHMGHDVTLTERRLELPGESSIGFQKMEDLFELKNYRNAFYKIWQPSRVVEPVMREGSYYAEKQIEISYKLDPLDVNTSLFEGPRLPRASGLLSRRESVKILLIGDSIARGFSSSGASGFGPARPAFGEMVSQWLKRYASITFINWSVEATTAQYGLERAGEIAKQTPDVVIVAFGTNDHTHYSTRQFVTSIQRFISRVRQGSPHSEFLVVSPMLPHPTYRGFQLDRIRDFSRALMALRADNVGVVNMTQIFDDLLKRKQYWDVTGNGLNHPNDFGHYLYATLIFSRLAPSRSL